jgi:hypothetical protein
MSVLALLLTAWPPLSFALALLIGRAIHYADNAERLSSARPSHPYALMV